MNKEKQRAVIMGDKNHPIGNYKKIISILGCAFLLFALLKLPDLLEHHDQSLQEKPEITYNAQCDISVGCSYQLEPGQVNLRILPNDLPVMESLDVQAELTGFQAEKISMEFIGKAMDMSMMPFSLYKQQGGNMYRGTGYISFCTVNDRMIWLARLSIETESNNHIIVFEVDRS